jgi:predicted nuclease of predicted toxin-antitoxin system
MRFLLDENVEYRLATFLQHYGHDVTAIAHDYLAALKDSEVLRISVREERILITNDRDFGELVVRRQLPHVGVILLRLHEERYETQQNRLLYVLTHHTQDMGRFIVVTADSIRVRQ